jgi:flagellar hook-length control protein FliK
MKIENKQIETARPTDAKKEDVRGKDDKKKGFSKAMEKARDKQGEAEGAANVMQPQAKLNDLSVADVKQTRAASEVRLTDNLVQEILVINRGSGSQEVHIQFDSKTMDGLRVQIQRENGVLSVKLMSQSDESAKLLSSNADQLAAALQAKGVQVATIQVQGPDRRPDVRRYHQRESRQDGQQQGGKQR